MAQVSKTIIVCSVVIDEGTTTRVVPINYVFDVDQGCVFSLVSISYSSLSFTVKIIHFEHLYDQRKNRMRRNDTVPSFVNITLYI